MSDKFESYVILLILWFVGCIIGWFALSDMPWLGAMVSGNSVVTCSIFIEVYGRNH